MITHSGAPPQFDRYVVPHSPESSSEPLTRRGENAASSRRSLRLAAASLFVISAVVLACGGRVQQTREGSETHFLRSCDGACPDGYECVCGVCTQFCSQSESCQAVTEAASCTDAQPRVAEGRCAADAPSAFCDVSCLVDDDCSSLGESRRCEGGFCRDGEALTSEETNSAGACDPSGVEPNDVLVLGDSLIELTTFTRSLENAAVDSGILQPNEHFRQAASSLNSFLAEGSLSIVGQYLTASAERSARVVVMDGGETDMFQGLCDSEPLYGCPSVSAAVSGAQNLLAQMARDGVEHVVYFFYPDPINQLELKESLDVLRPVVENVCGMSAVPCHWVDLRSSFAGRPELLAEDGMLFSDEGAAVAASAVWERMQARCIAQ